MTRASGEQGKAAPSRPREVTLAFVLFLVSAFPQTLAIAHFYAVQFAGLHLLLYLWFGARAARGRQGSRIGVTITVAVAWIFLAPVIWRNLIGPAVQFDAVYAAIGLLSAFAGVVGVVLLYGRNGNAHFSRA